MTTPLASRTLQAASFSSISVLHVASKRYCHTFQLFRTVCTPCILSKKKRSLQLITSTLPVERIVVRICVKFSRAQKNLKSPNPAQCLRWVVWHVRGRTSAVVKPYQRITYARAVPLPTAPTCYTNDSRAHTISCLDVGACLKLTREHLAVASCTRRLTQFLYY